MPTTDPDSVHITTGRNGPYVVTGHITISDHDDAAVTLPPNSTVALCRCGQSGNKPFCDGTHTTAGFDGTIEPSNRRAATDTPPAGR